MGSTTDSSKCSACKDGVQQPFPFTMAFQPIVDIHAGSPFAYEALVRGPEGQSSYSVLSQVTPENRYSFDQNCRVAAITLAARLGLAETGAFLSINFMPGAVYSPVACIQLTLKTARATGFPVSQLIFEITENEEVVDHPHLHSIRLARINLLPRLLNLLQHSSVLHGRVRGHNDGSLVGQRDVKALDACDTQSRQAQT